MGFTNVAIEMNRIRKELEKLEEEAVKDTKATTRYLLEQLFMRTPVNEGTTVRNFNVSISGFSSAFSAALGSGPPGPTNQMALGDEPRRGANESAARAAAEAALNFTKLTDVYINNTSPHADLVDAGEAPGGPNQVIRNPGGVTMIALQSTRNARNNWK